MVPVGKTDSFPNVTRNGPQHTQTDRPQSFVLALVAPFSISNQHVLVRAQMFLTAVSLLSFVYKLIAVAHLIKVGSKIE